MQTRLLIGAYIVANTAANLILIAVPAERRALASIAIACTFVALDLVSRDRLHDLWHGDKRKLGYLILAGALLSAAINYAAWPVAVASCLAFAAAGVADTAAYQRLQAHPWMWRSNGSNVASAFVDSAVFLGLAGALGVFPVAAIPIAFAGQFCAKVIGGLAWSYALRARAGAREG